MKLDFDSVLCARCGVSLLGPGHRLHAEAQHDPVVAAGLTRAERMVFLLLCNGLSNKQIAERLVISANTVRYHLKQVYLKLGVRSRSHAIALAGARAPDPAEAA